MHQYKLDTENSEYTKMSILLTINHLIYQNRIDQALQTIDQLEGPEIQIGKIIKCKILGDKGQFEASMQILQELSHLKTDDKLINFGIQVVKLNLFWQLGKYRQMEPLIVQSNPIISELPKNQITKFLIGYYHKASGHFHWDNGNLDIALLCYEKCLAIWRELGYTIEIAKSINNIGIIDYARGKYNSALDKYLKNVELQESISDNIDLSAPLSNIGEVYLDMGDLSKAIEYFKRSIQSIERSDTIKQSDLAYRYVNLGYSYSLQGELDQAFLYFNMARTIYTSLENNYQLGRTLSYIGYYWYVKNQLTVAESFLYRAIELLNTLENPLELSNTLFFIILVKIEQNDIVEASRIVKVFVEIDDKSDNRVIHLKYQLSRALIHSVASNYKDRALAISILENVISNSLRLEIIKNQARIALLYLYLQEYELLGNQVNFGKIESNIQHLYRYGQDQKSFPFIIFALLLNAKFHYLQDSQDKAKELVSIARFFSEFHSLNLQKSRIDEIVKNMKINENGITNTMESSNTEIMQEDRMVLEYLEFLKTIDFD